MMPYMDVMSVYDPVSVPITPFFLIQQLLLSLKFSCNSNF